MTRWYSSRNFREASVVGIGNPGHLDCEPGRDAVVLHRSGDAPATVRADPVATNPADAPPIEAGVADAVADLESLLNNASASPQTYFNTLFQANDDVGAISGGIQQMFSRSGGPVLEGLL